MRNIKLFIALTGVLCGISTGQPWGNASEKETFDGDNPEFEETPDSAEDADFGDAAESGRGLDSFNQVANAGKKTHEGPDSNWQGRVSSHKHDGLGFGRRDGQSRSRFKSSRISSGRQRGQGNRRISKRIRNGRQFNQNRHRRNQYEPSRFVSEFDDGSIPNNHIDDPHVPNSSIRPSNGILSGDGNFKSEKPVQFEQSRASKSRPDQPKSDNLMSGIIPQNASRYDSSRFSDRKRIRQRNVQKRRRARRFDLKGSKRKQSDNQFDSTRSRRTQPDNQFGSVSSRHNQPDNQFGSTGSRRIQSDNQFRSHSSRRDQPERKLDSDKLREDESDSDIFMSGIIPNHASKPKQQSTRGSSSDTLASRISAFRKRQQPSSRGWSSDTFDSRIHRRRKPERRSRRHPQESVPSRPGYAKLLGTVIRHVSGYDAAMKMSSFFGK